VDRELAFFSTELPPARFHRVLDVACGIGRHARALAEAGYEVTGIDTSESALTIARDGAPDGATFVEANLRELGDLPSNFDVVTCLWQSWGHLPDEENRTVLRDMTDRLRDGGRLLLDIYNREALATLPAMEVETRNGREFRTTRALQGDRFRVRIEYTDTGTSDDFEWQVFSPREVAVLGESVGLRHRFTCAWFDRRTPAGRNHVRMQALFERHGHSRDPLSQARTP